MGAAFSAGTPIQFRGSAFDPEDGPLEGDSLVWTIADVGQVGAGREVVLSNLEEGIYTLTLTGSDTNGQSNSSEVMFEVTAPVEPVINAARRWRQYD